LSVDGWCEEVNRHETGPKLLIELYNEVLLKPVPWLSSVDMMRILLLVMTSFGCRDVVETEDSQDSGVPSEASSLSERAGCSDLPSPFTFIEISETQIATVPQLEWQSESSVTPSLVLDPGDGRMLETAGESEAAAHGWFLVHGTPALRTGTVLLAVDTDAGRVCSEELTFDSGLLSVELPEITLSSYDPEGSEGGYTLAHLMTEGQNFMTILNEQGEYTWAAPISGGPGVAIGRDRQSLLYLKPDVDKKGSKGSISTTDSGEIVRMGLDGEVLEAVEMTGMHMDFVELPDGGFATLGFETREFTDETGAIRPLVGDTLMVASPDGRVETIWSSFDSIEPDLTRMYPWGFFEVQNMEDWTHGNGMDYDPDADAFFISLAGIHALVRVDGSTGAQDWLLQSEGGDFVDAEGSVQAPHSIQHLGDDRILVFNRNIVYGEDLPDDTEGCSQASELQLDMAEGSVDQLWSYGSEECVWVIFYGKAHRLEGGNTMVIFSSAGQIDETTPEGQTVWRVNTDVGGAFGYGERVSDFRLDKVLER
jgi:hypothetical protein